MDKGTPKPAEVVEGIVADLTDRRGLRHEWDNIDEDVIEELKNTWLRLAPVRLSFSDNRAANNTGGGVAVLKKVL